MTIDDFDLGGVEEEYNEEEYLDYEDLAEDEPEPDPDEFLRDHFSIIHIEDDDEDCPF